MKIKQIILDKRDKYTLLFWALFLAICFSNHFLFFWNVMMGQMLAIMVNLFVTIFFYHFMNKRAYYLDNPHLPVKCRYGRHDLRYENGYYMEGTGRYIGGQEIEKKRSKTDAYCQRTGCNFFESHRD
jgi:hypothetical protein